MQECQCGGAPLDLDLFRLLITGQPCETLRADSRNCTINGTSVASATLGAARSLNCTSPCFSIFFSAPAPAPSSGLVDNATIHEPGKLSHATVVGVSVGVAGAIVVLAVIVLVVCFLSSRRNRARFNNLCEEVRMQMAALPADFRKRGSRPSSRGTTQGKGGSDRFTVERCQDDDTVRCPQCAQASDTGESATSPVHDSAYDPEGPRSIRNAPPSVAQPSFARRPTSRPPVAIRDSDDTPRPRNFRPPPEAPEAPEAQSGDKRHFTSRHMFDRTRYDERSWFTPAAVTSDMQRRCVHRAGSGCLPGTTRAGNGTSGSLWRAC